MTRRLLGCGVACAMALSGVLSAQSAPPQNPPAQTPTPSTATSSAATADQKDTDQKDVVTVEGCLRPETKTPARDVPEAEQRVTNADDDYVLSDITMIKGTAPELAAETQPADKPIGTSGASAMPPMYKVKGESLKMGDHAGKRVQIDGTFEQEGRADNQKVFAKDLVRLRGTAIREVPGDCSKK
jgi:hypothetical protein